MAIEQRALEFNNFSGGITDNIIDGPINEYEKAENLVLTKDAKLKLAPGSEIIGSATYQIPDGAQRVCYLTEHDSTLFHTSLTSISYTGTSSNTNLLGPTSNDGFDVGASTNKVSGAKWNNHLYLTNDGFPNVTKIYKDSSSNWQLRTAGLPALASSPTVTKGASGSGTYIYSFVYYYTYTVNDSTFEDYGATTEVTITSAAAPNSNTVAITSIPAISNSTTLNYDTSNIKVRIYRTEDGGTVSYYVGEVTNGTTTYNDSSSDATISANDTLYTTGDIVDNDAPPKCKYLHVANNILWYAHVKEGSYVYPNKIRQSIAGDPDSCPTLFFAEVEDIITGMNSIQDKPIVFCEGSIYRLEGLYDELGKGSITSYRISDTIGCISNNSIVQAGNRLYFAGNDGFYWTDGYKIGKLTNHLNTTYSSLLSDAQAKLNIYGAFDKINNSIWWAVQSDSSSQDNDAVFILDLSFGNDAKGVFTTLGNSNSFKPTALTYFGSQIIRGDTRGYLLKHDNTYKTNPKINESDVPSNWTTETILYDYRSIYTSFGTTAVRKWVPWITVDLMNESNISVQITSDNDRSRDVENLQLLNYNDNIAWGDPTVIWGTTVCTWGVSGLIEQKKRFPQGTLRCNYKQIRMSNGYHILQNSDDYGTATVANGSGTGTATLDDTVNYDWNADSVDYKISFSNDSYATEFPITARTADVVTFLDIEDSAPTGSQSWVIKGYKKGEVFHLLSYTLAYGIISRSQRPFAASDLLENA